MELDSALSQMYSLCVNPSLVNKMSRARKATKNRFYRDDPAFVVLQVLFIAVSSIAVGCTAFGFSVIYVTENIIFDILSYAFWSIFLTSVTWWAVNKWMLDSSYVAEIHREVDWRYALDVHCNGYFFYFIWTRVLSFLFLPVILSPRLLPRVIANMFFFAGTCGYFYNLFLGYLELPMVIHQQKLLYPTPILAVWIVVATFFFSWSSTEWNFAILH